LAQHNGSETFKLHQRLHFVSFWQLHMQSVLSFQAVTTIVPPASVVALLFTMPAVEELSIQKKLL